jgi:hypothetical protein
MIKISASFKRAGITDEYILSSICGAISLNYGNFSFRVGDRLNEVQINNLLKKDNYKITLRK